MKSSKSKSTHVLLTLGILFSLGGAARFIPNAFATAEGSVSESDSDAAEAKPVDTDTTKKTDSTKAPKTPTPTTTARSSVCFTGETAIGLSKDKALVDAQAASLKQKELALKDWESKLTAETEQLVALQKSLESRWGVMQEESKNDLKHLSQMYASMKPDQAAQIFNQMDPTFAAGFLRQLSSPQAGLILAGMQTDKAYVVSVKLATMNDDIRNADQ